MDIKEFAEKYRLKVNDRRLALKSRLSHAEDIVLGRFGEIAEIGETFRVRFLAMPRDAAMTGGQSRYRRALAAGLEDKCKSGKESIFTFDPEDAAQVAIVLKLAGVRVRRRAGKPSEAQLAVRQAFADRRKDALQTLAA